MAIQNIEPAKERPRSGSDQAVLRISMPRCLLFSIERASKSKGTFTTDYIINIFLKYDPKTSGHGVDQALIEKCLIKYFVGTYPYELKDKLRGAVKPRKFCVVTNRNFVNNIKRLALLEAMDTNQFVVKVLSEAMMEELQDALLYRKKIPDY